MVRKGSGEVLEDWWIDEGDVGSFQLDLYLSFMAIAIEYQGKQHYDDVHCFSPQEIYKEKDYWKRIRCEKLGITLVALPFDHKEGIVHLKEAVCEKRQDLWNFLSVERKNRKCAVFA